MWAVEQPISRLQEQLRKLKISLESSFHSYSTSIFPSTTSRDSSMIKSFLHLRFPQSASESSANLETPIHFPTLPVQPKAIIGLSKEIDTILTPQGDRVYLPPANVAFIIFSVPKFRDAIDNPALTSAGSKEPPVPITLTLYQEISEGQACQIPC